MKPRITSECKFAIAFALSVGVWGSDTMANQSANQAPLSAAIVLFVGDGPYPDKDNLGAAEAALKKIRDKLNSSSGGRKDKPSLIIHLGDFQNGAPDCSASSHFENKAKEIFGIAPKGMPLVYTPGDNDWTDCDRGSNGIDEFIALERLRKAFFNDARIELIKMSLKEAGSKTNFKSQGKISIEGEFHQFKENMRWIYKGILFATVHLVANENGRQDIRIHGLKDPIMQAKAREVAAERWVSEAYTIARENNSIRAVVVATQADPDRDIKWICDGISGVSKKRGKDCKRRKALPSVFDGFLIALDAGARSLQNLPNRGSVPVLFAHGDTGGAFLCRVDQKECMQNKSMDPCMTYTPLPNTTLKSPNLWRLNAMGDYQWDAVLLKIDPLNPLPFQAFQYLKPTSEITSCRHLTGEFFK